MREAPVRDLNKETRDSSSKSPHLTGINDAVDTELAVLASSDDNKAASKPVKPLGQASYLKDLISQAKKGGEDIVPNAVEKTDVQKSSSAFTADQFESVQSILATLNKHGETAHDRDRQLRESHSYSTVPVDINGNSNYSKDAVYYRPHDSTTKAVAGVSYHVSDTQYACNRCTYYRKCDRHRETERRKTDISLCADNHVRMTVWWDIIDPENRKGSWRFEISEKYDRFGNPRWEREDHERVEAAKRKAQEQGEDLTKEEQGCGPVEPKWRIKKLAERIIEDYNEEQKNVARRAVLDPKGREYYTKPYHWGGKDPFTPSPNASTRAAHEYKPSESRVERELRVLLQAWYKSQVKPELRMRDRTSAAANEIWAEKMVNLKMAKAARRESVGEEEGLGRILNDGVRKQKIRNAQVEQRDRYKMTSRAAESEIVAGKSMPETVRAAKNTKTGEATITEQPPKLPKKAKARQPNLEESDENTEGGDVVKAPRTMGAKKAPRALTAEERELLKQMKLAADAEAKDDVEADGDEPVTPQDDDQITFEKTTETRKHVLKVSKKTGNTVVSEVPRKLVKKTIPSLTVATKSEPKVKAKRAKRKASIVAEDVESAQKKTRKHYKSADIIEDSDEEADYELPAAPALELPEQREGWKFDEALSTQVEELVKVVQTDKLPTTNATVVVEQGTTIVREIGTMQKHDQTGENEAAASAKMQDVEHHEIDATLSHSCSDEVSAAAVIEEVEDSIPTPPRSPHASSPISSLPAPDHDVSPPASAQLSSSPDRKRKVAFADSSDDEEPTPSKKAKKVRFASEIVSPVSRPRKMSIPFIVDLEGDRKWQEEVVEVIDEVEGGDGGGKCE
jgi:hypothetical protein